MRARVLHCAVLSVLLLAVPSIASAHGRLKGSSPGAGAHLPAPPRELRFEFSEVPELAFSLVRLVGPDGEEVALGPLGYSIESRRTVTAAIARPLQSGTYVVQWQLAGDDGHPVRGTFDFVIAPDATTRGQGSSVPMQHHPGSVPEGNGFGAGSVAYVAVRWIQFVALLLAIGAVSFRQFVLAFLRRKEDPDSLMLDVAESRAARVGFWSAAVLAVALVLRPGGHSLAMRGAGRPRRLGLMGRRI